MIALAIAAGLLVAAVLQVTFAPLFPVSGATFDVPLVALVLLIRFRGPRTAMVVLPVLALFAAFLTDRAPALLLIAYMPLLPLAYWLEERGPPIGNFLRTLGATVAVGVWLRAIFVISAVAQGADFDAGVLIGTVLLPGLFLDFALLTLAYAPLRLLGWQERSMRLQRTSFSTL